MQLPAKTGLEISGRGAQLDAGSARGGTADAPDLGSGPERVGGSNPLARTTFIEDFEDNDVYRTVTAQIEAVLEKPKVRFPKIIRFRRIEATIYGKRPKYPFYCRIFA